MSKHAKPAPAPAAFDPLSLAARLVVGAVLVFSGTMKAAAPAEEFAVVIETYNILPPGNAVTMATFLPWVETLVGWSLILGLWTRGAAVAAGGLLATFVLAILSTKARGIPLANCGCFGGGFHPSPTTTIVLDTVLAGLAFLAFKRGPRPPSLDNWAGTA